MVTHVTDSIYVVFGQKGSLYDGSYSMLDRRAPNLWPGQLMLCYVCCVVLCHVMICDVISCCYVCV